MPRFVLLQHVGHPDDPACLHYDLLLEEANGCRTWRLAAIPVAGGQAVAAAPLPAHRLAWLEVLAAEVSGRRGFARRLDAGGYANEEARPATPETSVTIRLEGDLLRGSLRFSSDAGWVARLEPPAHP
ncbi:MAG: hypothetical protein FJ284_07515 [Planctomycetes bacterium]|nr:hypothetical protein [Planctomycetota bacterium]